MDNKIHIHLLIVEDASSTGLCEEKDINAFFTYKRADNNFDAMHLLNEGNFDVIVIDLSLEEHSINGIELMMQIKKHSEYSHIPIIATTSYPMTHSKNEIMELGFDDFIHKPISRNEVYNNLIELSRKAI